MTKNNTIINNNTINETNIDVLISYIVSNRILVKKSSSNADNSISINKNHSVSNKFNMGTTYTTILINLSVLLLVFK